MCDTADGRHGWTHDLRGRIRREAAQIAVGQMEWDMHKSRSPPGGIRRSGESHAAVDAGLRERTNRERADTGRPP